MTKIFYPLFLVAFFCVFLQPVLALEITVPTRVQVEIVESPAQKTTRLKSTYGSSNFYDCYSKYQSCNSSAPWNVDSCFSSVEYCLESKQLQNQVIQPTKSNDQVCSDKFGPNWKWDSGTICGCKVGYFLSGSSCVTGKEYCRNRYGENAFYFGSNNGVADCPCKIGYSLNEQQTSCVATPIVSTKTNDQICQDNYGSNSNWNGTKSSNGGLNCGCENGYQYDQGKKQCVVVENKITPKSETIKKDLPAVIKPLITDSVDITSTTAVDIVATEQIAQIEQSVVESNNRPQPKISIFKEITTQGFFPWLFRSVGRWFKR